MAAPPTCWSAAQSLIPAHVGWQSPGTPGYWSGDHTGSKLEGGFFPSPNIHEAPAVYPPCARCCWGSFSPNLLITLGPHRCSGLNVTGDPVQPTPSVHQEGPLSGQTSPDLPTSAILGVTAAQPCHPASEPRTERCPRTRGVFPWSHSGHSS